MDRLSLRVIQGVVLTLTAVAFLVFLVRSAITGEDIPTGWITLIGGSWGALLGVQEIIRRGGNGPERPQGSG